MRRIGDVQNSGFESFSRITAIRKDSKNRKSGSVSLLTNYCSCCFSIVADNVILATDTTKTKFWRKFFGRLFSKRCGTVAVLRSLRAILNPLRQIISSGPFGR